MRLQIYKKKMRMPKDILIVAICVSQIVNKGFLLSRLRDAVGDNATSQGGPEQTPSVSPPKSESLPSG